MISSAIKIFKNIINFVIDIFVPEDKRIEKLLDIEPETMRQILPKSKVFSKDKTVLFDYNNKIVKLLIKSVKYKNNLNIKKRIASYLHEEIVSMSSDISLFHGKIPVLLSIPMTTKEKRERGFNQCEELCREIEKMDESKNVEVLYNILVKERETERQAKLNREERLLNVLNSMSVKNPEKIKNRAIIIIDDVFTTGATYEEARRALSTAGAKSIFGLFIAH